VTVLVGRDDGDRALIRVVDEGEGIAPDLLPPLFHPFTQADNSLARARGGLGLGLAIVRGLVELHGGSVEARSAGVGRGAEFRVVLPLLHERPP
jgi:signal transduction histidine kinase